MKNFAELPNGQKMPIIGYGMWQVIMKRKNILKTYLMHIHNKRLLLKLKFISEYVTV